MNFGITGKRLGCYRCDEENDFQIWIGVKKEIQIGCNNCGETIAAFKAKLSEEHYWIGKIGNPPGPGS